MSISRGCGSLVTACRELDQLVRRIAHRRNRDDDVVARERGRRHAARNALQRVGVGNGRAAVLLDYEGHG